MKGGTVLEYVLDVKNVTKYFGKRRILNGINLQVRPGEVMGFIGPNGAGKTTAIKVILGFLSDDGGEISICGLNVKADYEKAMGLVGGIVENPDMYKQFSGRLNLEMYARTHDNVPEGRIDEVTAMVGLENRINDKVKKYSLGMKQRLGLAMSMLHKPRLLILDEPTNGLDPAGIKELRDIILHLAHDEGVGVLISSHQLAEMQNLCDRASIIVNGDIVAEDTLDALNFRVNGEPTHTFDVDDPMASIKIINDFFAETEAEGARHSARCDASTGSVIAAVDSAKIPEIVRRLAFAGVNIYGVKASKSTLEDAFIAITGGGNTIA